MTIPDAFYYTIYDVIAEATPRFGPFSSEFQFGILKTANSSGHNYLKKYRKLLINIKKININSW